MLPSVVCVSRLLANQIHTQLAKPPVTSFLDVHAVATRWYSTTDLFAVVVLLGGARVILNLRVRVF